MMRTVTLFSVALLTVALGLVPVGAQAPAQSVRASSPVSIVGRDVALSVVGNVAPACAGQDLDAGLFVRDRADPKVITPFGSLAATSASTVVNSDGTFAASVPLPRELPDGPIRVWPGVQGDCLDAPVVDDSLGVELAVLDPVRNPGSTSTILLSSAALASVSNGPDKVPLGAFLGSVDVRADGESCASIATESVSAGSAPLALRLGEAGQPAACSKPGAHLTFLNKRGQQLFVEMDLIPGTTRLLDNFAAAPPGTGEPGHDAPAPPDTGQEAAGGSREQTDWGPAGAGLIALAALLGAAGFVARRRA